jgi:ribosomal protein S18 acetylase RimI-like enzyme
MGMMLSEMGSESYIGCDLQVRRANADDLLAIADLHTASWRTAYRQILPDAYLDGPLIEDRRAHWSGVTQKMALSDRLLIAERGNWLCGFIAAWASADLGCEAGFTLFIDNLHVRPELRSQNIGRLLMRSLATSLNQGENCRAYLWLLDGNENAGRFYAKLGGRRGDRRRFPIAGQMLGETRIEWDDLRRLRE